MDGFLFSALIYLAAAVVAVPVAARLGLGSVLGYLAAGILIGPVLGIVGQETQELQHFAEFGVVMMLFLIGLELEPRALWAMRDKLLGLGGLQIVVTTGVVTAGGLALGLAPSVALAIGLAFSLSSTAIVLQTLSEKNLMQTRGGRSVFAVLLTQDIAVIPMLALLPLLAIAALPEAGGAVGHGHGAVAEHGADHGGGHGGPEVLETAQLFIETLPGWAAGLVTMSALGGIIVIGIYGTRPVFSYIHATGMREMFTALALLIVIATAALMLILGLSPALGTFVAGVVLANSEFRHEMESDLQPFKGLLLGLFFITVGAGIDFGVLFGAPLQLLGITLALMLAKGAVLYVLALIFRLQGRDKWLFTLGLAQAGEFGFVLIGFALQRDVVPVDLAQPLFLIVALSMLLTPLFFIAYDLLSRRMRPDTPTRHEADPIEQQGPIIIAGIGRFGQVVNRMIQASGFNATVLDHDLATIRLMREFGFKGFLGDPTRPELLHAAGLAKAQVLVVAMDDKAASTKIVRFARKARPDLHIVARAYDRVHVYELYQAGADSIVREMFDSSLRAARYVLEALGISEYEAAQMERVFFQYDRRMVRELAKVWKPDIPVTDNPEYLARAKELNAELETALVSELGEAPAPASIADRRPPLDLDLRG